LLPVTTPTPAPEALETSATGRRPRRDRRRDRNRRALVDAALELSGREGAAALTVSRVARLAGIEPPNFYAYFRTVEECEQAAAEAFDAYLATKARPHAAIRAAQSREEAAAAQAALLASWLEEPAWSRLILRARLEDSRLGERSRRFLDRARNGTRAALARALERRGLTQATADDIEGATDLCVGHFLSMVESLLDGRTRDVHAAGAIIAESDRAVVRSTFERVAKRRV
ncbi:MAG: helix-turn-helix transcriptional regulator, partial [Deltaproteobacteria bacterium]|nr:helix-turn-helix transcriptional regulator [Deltaproteobacteria bacterium]